MNIDKLSGIRSADIYYSEGFRRTIESYIPTFLSSSSTSTIQLSPHDLHKYEFDFFGLLAAHGVPEKYRWIIMRINGITSPMDFSSELGSIRIPSDESIERIRQIYSGMQSKLAV